MIVYGMLALSPRQVREKATDDQQIALEKGIRLESDETQPESSDDHK